MDRLMSMEVFVRAAELGSFVRAATALGMTPQMAGKHITALEERCGTRLVHRTTRRQSLTEAGRVFYERCKIVLAEAEAAEAEVESFMEAPKGLLRISAPLTFGSYCLAPLVTRYLQLHPNVAIDLVLSDRYVDLAQDGFDAAVRLGPLTVSTLVARPLAPYRLLACASPSYVAAFGAPQTPEALSEHSCLGFLYWSKPTTNRWHFSRGDERHMIELQTRLRVNNFGALHAAVLAGFGIALCPEVAIQSDLRAGRLVQVLESYEIPTRALHLLYSLDRRPTPKRRTFIEFLLAELGPKRALGEAVGARTAMQPA